MNRNSNICVFHPLSNTQEEGFMYSWDMTANQLLHKHLMFSSLQWNWRLLHVHHYLLAKSVSIILFITSSTFSPQPGVFLQILSLSTAGLYMYWKCTERQQMEMHSITTDCQFDTIKLRICTVENIWVFDKKAKVQDCIHKNEGREVQFGQNHPVIELKIVSFVAKHHAF